MGFNPWNTFGTNAQGQPKLPGSHGFNYSVMMGVADALVRRGFKDAGYTSVNLDCGWSTGYRDPKTGLILVNETLFPGGLEAYVAGIRKRGLEPGLYLDAGPSQCCSRHKPGANDGSLGHEAVDAAWLAGLGFTWLKYDDCGNAASSYGAMAKALNATGKYVMLSVHGPTLQPAVGVSNMWRATPDITNTWDSMLSRAMLTATAIGENKGVSGPGSWAMADMLEAFVGTAEDPGLTFDESRTHFAIWAALKSPLVLGADPGGIKSDAVATLVNDGAIAINQDPLGVPALVVRNTTKGLWLTGPLSGDRFVALVVNVAEEAGQFDLKLDMLPGWKPGRGATIADVWTGRVLGHTNSSWSSTLLSHASAFLVVS